MEALTIKVQIHGIEELKSKELIKTSSICKHALIKKLLKTILQK